MRVAMMAGLMLALLRPAMGQDNVADISFRGTLHEPPPCTLNGGQQIDVDFGEVDVNSVDGIQNTVPVNYTLACQAATGGTWTYMTLRIDGATTSFDPQALQTSVSDLGVRLVWVGGQTLTPGANYGMTESSPPGLEAVLVKKSGSSLPEGQFEVISTLVMEYQ